MVPIEEAPPTPVKEKAKTKLTVIQEARIKAREKVKRLQEAQSNRQAKQKTAETNKARSSMSLLELETREEEFYSRINHSGWPSLKPTSLQLSLRLDRHKTFQIY